MGKVVDLTGQRFGRLVVLKRVNNDNCGKAQWLCQCDCDKSGENLKVVSRSNLKSGNVISCGCFQREWTINNKTTHGLKKKKMYSSWSDMIRRCNDPKHKQYKYYGERGITVCDEWLDVKNFYKDMGDRPEGYSIERIDVNGNYCKENCCWIPKEKQARNKRNITILEYEGQIAPLATWAEIFKIKYKIFRKRYDSGWTIGQILGYEERKGKFYNLSALTS